MDYVYNLTWPQARELTKKGARVRRANWTDRWIFQSEGALFWLSPDSGPDRVVQSTDFTKAEFLASDWTTMWPDQHQCILPSPDPIPDPPPPDPDPQPDPGGPIIKTYTYYKKLGTVLYTAFLPGLPQKGYITGIVQVLNPFSVACSIVLTGVADDYFFFVPSFLSGKKVGQIAPRLSQVYQGGNSTIPQSNRGWPFSVSFILAAGDKFSIAAADTEGGVATYHLTATFTP